MRLIDKDALLDAYDKAHDGPPGAARKLIEDAPAVDWISVKDRLPSESGPVLVVAGSSIPIVVNYSKVYKAFNHYDFLGEPEEEDHFYVTHWMHYPDVPQEEDKNEDH